MPNPRYEAGRAKQSRSRRNRWIFAGQDVAVAVGSQTQGASVVRGMTGKPGHNGVAVAGEAVLGYQRLRFYPDQCVILGRNSCSRNNNRSGINRGQRHSNVQRFHGPSPSRCLAHYWHAGMVNSYDAFHRSVIFFRS